MKDWTLSHKLTKQLKLNKETIRDLTGQSALLTQGSLGQVVDLGYANAHSQITCASSCCGATITLTL